jgi:DNA modification methylase
MSVINSIICDDVIGGLKKIPDGIVTLALTSPPYNVDAMKWDYAASSDNMPYREYIEWLADVFADCYRTLRTGGRLAVNIDAMTNRQEDKDESYLRDIRTDLTIELRKIGYKFFGEHIWYKSSKAPFHGECPNCKKIISVSGGQFCGKKTAWGSYMSPSTPAVRRNHEYILIFSKEQFKLERDAFSGEPDITAEDFQNFIASTWNLQPETRNLGNHPVPFPYSLAERTIRLYTYKQDCVLDCFNGVGTTTFAAKVLGRRYIGIDISPDYCKYAQDRIATTGLNIFE